MAGSNLTVTVDPTDAIDEYDFANNALSTACPASTAAARG